MTDLIYTEKELVQSLRDYINAEESKLAAVKRFAQPFCKWPTEVKTQHTCCCLSLSWANKLDTLTRMTTLDPEGYLGHPVNAYKLMKRLNTEWSELENLVLQNPSDGETLLPPKYQHHPFLHLLLYLHLYHLHLHLHLSLHLLNLVLHLLVFLHLLFHMHLIWDLLPAAPSPAD